ncbi:MAG: gamma-glutamyltransferase, partial [Acidobacteria bacterium]|nr:gamma-glutamyltransferase [Acidobacteriota bacterium]
MSCLRPWPAGIVLAAVLLLGPACRTAPSGAAPGAVPGAAPDRAAASASERTAALVVAPEPRAARIGAEVLEAGGNAIDAAVATHLALAVTFPYAGNLGGGGFCVVREPGGRALALDFRETAPAAATRSMFLDARGEVEPGLSLYTLRAAGVPGSVAGLAALHAAGGVRAWPELFSPAIALAEQGFVLDAWTARSFAERAAELATDVPPALRSGLNFARTFRGREGETFRQPELAQTLRRIAAHGPDEFYRGRTAELIVAAMRAGGGLITAEDLAGYRALWRTPLEGNYRGHRVISMPPPSSGGVMLIQLLHMLEGFTVPPPGRAAQAHLFAELEKRAFADRAHWLGDPDRVAVPTASLISKEYARARAAAVASDRRTDPGSISAGAPAPAEHGETLHFSVVDRERRAVSCTTTINDAYGSGIVVDGAGFLLNNEMDDFAAKPGAPNLYGVVGGEANAVAGGKRMLSTMTPTIVERPDGSPWLVLGSPGGSTIVTTVFQVVSHAIDAGLPLPEAVAAPRVHHQWPPAVAGRDVLRTERDPRFALPAAELAALSALGYAIEPRGALGNVQAIALEDGAALGAPDPRGIGAAAGAPSPAPRGRAGLGQRRPG